MELGLGIEEFDVEGRTIIAEYTDLVLINCYFPNGGRNHSRVPKLAFYDPSLRDARRCARPASSDLLRNVNTAHREIDLARPKENQTVTGFLPEERA